MIECGQLDDRPVRTIFAIPVGDMREIGEAFRDLK